MSLIEPPSKGSEATGRASPSWREAPQTHLASGPEWGEARVTYRPATEEYEYEVVEPALSETEAATLHSVLDRLIDELPTGVGPHPEARRRVFRPLALACIRSVAPALSAEAGTRLAYYLERDTLGYGPIDVPMNDPAVEDISCDGAGIPIYVHHRARGSIRTTVRFPTALELDRFVVWLAQRSGRHLSAASPMLEAALPEGARLYATLGTFVTSRGSSFTIRRFRERPLTPVDLIGLGTLAAEPMAYLWLAVESGRSGMICGGTASGKTTTLNALLSFVPPEMKIVSIEDTREIRLPHENWVALVTRSGVGRTNPTTGKPPGEVDMFDLLSTALRQRPQYLTVGEVRGPEAYIVFQAMATGKTCLTTFHAEDVEAMVHRMENPPISLPRALFSALGFVVLQRQIQLGEDHARRVHAITEVVGLDSDTGELITNAAYVWDAGADRFHSTGQSYVLDRIARERNQALADVERELARRAELLELLGVRSDRSSPERPFTYPEFGQAIAQYYRDPIGALAHARAAVERVDRADPPLGPAT
ncbi:type II secretion system protein E [mine drainage metagenome]|uniref:Type II secretion system protein E n=1 Tax=mine drainage metagenome TaxID=410659 RepID=T1BRW6_9ZZZZ